VTIDAGPNWDVGVVEVPTGGGSGVLVVTARHLVEPHAPPSPAGLFLFAVFGPLRPGLSGNFTDSQPHEDDPGYFDELVSDLLALDATTSRLNITLNHTFTAVPEPAGGVLILSGLLGVRLFRRRSGG
jgi:hypothetical protein